MIRVADYIMQRLHQAGVGHLFMVTGRGILYLSDAAAKLEGLSCISVHHEQAGAYAAMAYAQKNERIGACLVSTGCAGTNAVTGALCAWQDDVPCVFISGQNTLKETVRHTKLPVRTFGQQEADIVGIVAPITKYAVMIEDPSRIAYEMDKALYLAQSGRKGPVWIDVPLDVQNMRVEPDELERFVPENAAVPEIADKDIEYVRNALKEAERPVVMIGGGIRSAGAIDQFKDFAVKNNLPVVYAASSVDVFGAENELSIGAVGTMAANRAANFTVQNADLLVVLGCRLSSMVVGSDPDKFARHAKIIIVDIDPHEPAKNTVKADKVITADAKAFLEKIALQSGFSVPAAWREKCLHWKRLFPKCEDRYKTSGPVDLYALADSFSRVLSDKAAVITDAGLEELIIPTTIAFKGAQRCLHPASQGAMGYALPATLGAHCAGAEQVVAVIGDGSIMMNIQELQTISHHGFPVKIFVINNNCYAVIRKRQVDLFRTRTVGTDPSDGVSCPDFKKVAECFGLSYERIETPDGLDKKLASVLNRNEPVLCEVISPQDQSYIHSSYARNKQGRFVQRPIEDQSPYLDRDLFLSEMIVDPIDQ